jgi:hypothetical protein
VISREAAAYWIPACAGHDSGRWPAAGEFFAETFGYTASQLNALPLRRIFPTVGEGKCAVQHSVSVSQ